jgi:phosphatidylglycerophosphate synthase
MLVQFAVLGVVAASVGLRPAGWLAGATYAVVTWAALILAMRRSGMRSLGPANAVTLVRATLVGGVTALVASVVGHQTSTAVLVTLVSLALIAWLLDAVDGQVARRTGSTSTLGARFDGEIDAFLILVLSLFVALSLGPWVLVIGAFRYVFVAVGWWQPWLQAPLPRRQVRSAVAALQGIVLVVASADVVATPVMTGVVAFALVSLGWSFGHDVRWLWQVRPATGYEPAPEARSVPVVAAGTHASRQSPHPSR